MYQNPYMNPYMQNPYQNQMYGNMNPYQQNPVQQMQQQANVNSFPHYEVLKVNGESGADTLQMNPRSSILVLDGSVSDKLLVWYIETDDAGAKKKCPYVMTPYTPEQMPDIKSFEQRLSNVERFLNERFTQPENGNAERTKSSGTAADE